MAHAKAGMGLAGAGMGHAGAGIGPAGAGMGHAGAGMGHASDTVCCIFIGMARVKQFSRSLFRVESSVSNPVLQGNPHLRLNQGSLHAQCFSNFIEQPLHSMKPGLH